MALVVVRPGVMTTVQDQGRVGFQQFGVPGGGAADLGAFTLANALLGNPLDAATLELTLVGGAFRAEADLAIALAGAPLAASVDSVAGATRPWSIPQTGMLRAGETLVLGGSPVGARCYLAVRGGWQTAIVLTSRSSEQPARKGDRFLAAPGETTTRRPTPEVIAAFGVGRPTNLALPFRWVAGPEYPLAADPTALLTGLYQVLAESNRIGVRLAGTSIMITSDPDRLSRPVAPGAIQVAGGQPILLGVAGGTIGGYPHVGQIIAADLDRVGQLRPGDTVRFERVELAAARGLAVAQRQLRASWHARFLVWAGV